VTSLHSQFPPHLVVCFVNSSPYRASQKRPVKAQRAGNGHSLVKRCNAGRALLAGSLRAHPCGVIYGVAPAWNRTTIPAQPRLAADPTGVRCRDCYLRSRPLKLIGRPEIPVLAGATYPLINSEGATARWETLYGKLAYKGAWTRSWPAGSVTRTPYHAADVVPPLLEGAPTLQSANETAAAFMVRKVREFPGEVTILGLGPFTNIALATRLDEGFAAHAKQLVFMGGSFNPDASGTDEFSLQFIYNPRTEFNSRWDPEASQMMLHAGWKSITSIPLDATVPAQLTPALVKQAGAGNTPVARYFARYAEAGFPMWDEVAAAVLIKPSIATATTKLAMDVVIDHGAAYGATLSWPTGAGPGLGEPDVTVVRAVDVGRLDDLFVQLLQGK
jgi:purine nucleosidase